MFCIRWWAIVDWIAHGLTLLSDKLLLVNCLLCCDTVLVVVEKFSTKQETKLGVISLFVFCHLLKFGAISRHKLS